MGAAEFQGFPAAGAGVAGADDSLRVAFFGLGHDDDLTTPVAVLARDEAGNEASIGFVDRVFPKPFRKSRIEVDDRFLQRVVPDILTQAPELGLDAAREYMIVPGSQTLDALRVGTLCYMSMAVRAG